MSPVSHPAAPRTGVLVLLLPLATACGLLDAEARRFEEERTYEHVLLSPAECEAAWETGYEINCAQWIEFEPDGDVAVLLTDIVNGGTYRIEGKRVLLSMDATPELPARLEYVLSADGSTLTDAATGKVWTLRAPP